MIGKPSYWSCSLPPAVSPSKSNNMPMPFGIRWCPLISLRGGYSANKKLPNGFDLISEGPCVTVQLTGHDHVRRVKFCFGAQGNQCAVFRVFVSRQGRN